MKIFSVLCLSLLASNAFSWTITTSFEDGALGSTADRGGDGFHGSGGGSTYTNQETLKGKSARLSISEGQTGFGVWGGEFKYPKTKTGETIWFHVHVYFPSGFDHYSYGEGGRLKFLRLQTLSSSGQNRGYNDLYINTKGSSVPFRWIYEGRQRWSDVGNPEDLIVPDTWESYQMAVTLDDVSVQDGGLAEVRIWKNGVRLAHITDSKTLTSDSDYSDRGLLFTYWNGGAPKTQHMYVDEITITNEAPITTDAFGYPMLPSLNSNKPKLTDVIKQTN